MTTIGKSVRRAVKLLKSGAVVALPTETVYGLGADASNSSAVREVFHVKGRPANHPLIVHIRSRRLARRWASQWGPDAEKLARAFWPGPLTIIVPRSSLAHDVVTGGRSTVALRVPSHPKMRRVLRHLSGVAAPSANRFGEVSPSTAQHVAHDLEGAIDYVLDGGPCDIGVESTIVDCSVSPPQLLRPGGITLEQLQMVVPDIATAQGESRAPGMLESHYAPRCRVITLEDATNGPGSSETVRVLDASRNPTQFAHDIYALLRKCDDDGISVVYVVLPPKEGIGLALRDRLQKASARH